MKTSSIAIAALAMLAPSLGASACGASETTTGPSSHSGPLLTYLEEGGIGGPRPSLAISRQARATLRLGGCNTSFGLGSWLWRRVRAVLGRADLPSIAGNYPSPDGSADMITYVVRSGGNEVRIAPDPQYEKVLAQIEPLFAVLGQTVAKGKRKLPASCASNRVGVAGSGGGSS